ncbi:5-formyltetrahydrofolate cyclo-ligase [Hahella sp. CCB-MM4]|uniref:5-formyltetrahydrofolate cyclo-ligase n=1 Tax=Hahella sp. (strain CCB-MM4) TaxID=1926491 RepID=UPI000B9B4D1A|nr:5-formyltetrahydrofolate cyclo-ligase [Hahella sp. CCB-MM4]OZG74907.1 5-formyltetrahydrofolate cyclo-ligase [Hahella sp. CCB-MM4]
MNKTTIRRQMRQKRRSLSAIQQKQASILLARQIERHHLRFQKRWALYFANDGEISPAIWLKKVSDRNHAVYLPVLHPIHHNRLWFLKLDANTRLRKNKYGIFEPDPRTTSRTPAWALNVICFPLVAFDTTGNRLGMGGGYYDRTFAPIRTRIKKPKLVGLAHDFQQVEELPSEPWDIALHGVATDRAFYRFAR